ncbi:DUF3053 family protein [Bordetella sp. 2513F-2]
MPLCLLRRFAGCLAATLALAGCVDREPESRAAFIRYLQAHAGDAAGILPAPATPEAREGLGEYRAHLEVIEDFQGVLRDNLALVERAGAALRLQRVEDLLARRDTWSLLRADLQRCGPAIAKANSIAVAARAELAQPADLQPLYETVFGKAVTQPAEAVPAWCAALGEAVDDAARLTQYIQARTDQFQLGGDQVQVRDPSVMEGFNRLAERLNGRSAAVESIMAQARAWATADPAS